MALLRVLIRFAVGSFWLIAASVDTKLIWLITASSIDGEFIWLTAAADTNIGSFWLIAASADPRLIWLVAATSTESRFIWLAVIARNARTFWPIAAKVATDHRRVKLFWFWKPALISLL